jgi:hypothetical protein
MVLNLQARIAQSEILHRAPFWTMTRQSNSVVKMETISTADFFRHAVSNFVHGIPGTGVTSASPNLNDVARPDWLDW